MKKQFLTIAMVLFTSVLMAQDFKPFKVGLGFGYAAPADGGGGIALYIEPAYRVTDEIAVGFRIEAAVLAKVVNENEGSLATNGSYSVNGQYYLSNNNFRPYVGLGAGLFTQGGVSFDDSSAEVAGSSKIGFYPRIGFDLGHFNFIFDYHLIPATKESVTFDNDGISVSDDVTIKNSYFSAKIGFSIGGGKN